MLYLRGTPKSGTTWLETICNELVKEACALCNSTMEGSARNQTGASCPCAHSTPFTIDGKHRAPGLGAILDQDTIRVTRAWEKCVHVEGSASIPRCMRQFVSKASSSADALPPTDRYLLIERNPIGIAVSWRHLPWGSAAGVQSLCHHAAMNMAARHAALHERADLVFYEDLTSDPRRAYRIVATALNLSLSHATMDAVINRTSFEAMQLMEKHHMIPGPSRYGTPMAKVRAGGEHWLQDVTATDVVHCLRNMKLHLPPDMYKRYP